MDGSQIKALAPPCEDFAPLLVIGVESPYKPSEACTKRLFKRVFYFILKS